MKPLELTVYPPMPTTESLAPLTREEAFRELKRASDLNDQLVDKHFSDAELAAEYWRSDADALARCHADSTETEWPEDYDKQAETLMRFATLPSYDEAPE